MKFATVRDLKNRTSEMLRVAARGKDVLITNNGKPIAVLHGIDEENLEDYVLSHHPDFRKSIEEASRQVRKTGGMPLEEFIRRLESKKGKRRGKLRS